MDAVLLYSCHYRASTINVAIFNAARVKIQI